MGKAAGAWRWSPTPCSADVKERVELYIYPPSGPSWPVLGWTVPLPLPVSLKSSSIRLRILPRLPGKESRKPARPTKYFDLCLIKITDMDLVLKRNPFYLVLPPFSFSWSARYNKVGIIAGLVVRIISDKYETASSGNEEDAMMFSGDTNSDSSLSELAYFLVLPHVSCVGLGL